MSDIVILAAGKGTRMHSSLPKVVQPLAGQPMLNHLLKTAKQIESVNIHVIIGYQAEMVMNRCDGFSVNWVLQEDQLGTGHAVLHAIDHCQTNGTLLVLYGDVPLVKQETMQTLLQTAQQKGFALLTVELDDPTGYGRIVRDAHNHVVKIVEEKDATHDEKAINECNTGIMAVSVDLLKRCLPNLSNENAQNEYYLTDIVAMAHQEGIPITTYLANQEEVFGANDRIQLAKLERFLQRQYTNNLLRDGATLIDPDRVDVRGQVSIGQDVIIDCNVIFEGDVTLGDRVAIGANCIIRNAKIDNDVTIEAFSHIDSANIGAHAKIGPFARIRPDTLLGEQVKVGNFVEIKKSNIGKASKINHLSYIGDSIIESNVNVGAGTITCNYDGQQKHQTYIKEDAFIGSNASLVAPVEIGKGATVGAGSTITKNVPDHQLGLGRAKQVTLQWELKKTKSKADEN